ncbi:hypothetical protein LTR36_008923 [Oleoguttula mirabilis]|uniref:Uncharacterized protein n=1 Tax=Oleoguttula mirabilis TaxID=1507867 RepID=A0AAV9J7M8_9PEZI|nr:hypothetical protein LTR36_008923 [Oleoguttula mirabilis]
MAQHETTEGGYGPGTYVDTSFTPLPQECRRLLKYFAQITPGFTQDDDVLNDVDFVGNELPILPGPLKAQAMSAVLHAMCGLVGREISEMRGVETGKITINTDQAGLYPASASLVSINGKTMNDMAQDPAILAAATNLEHGALMKNPMHLRAWSIYPTKDAKVWYQIMSNLDAPGFLKAYGMDSEAPVKSNDEAYDLMKAEFSKYSAGELETKNVEHGFCGQTCYTPQQWRKTLMGKRLAGHPIFNVTRARGIRDLPPVPFPFMPADKRPLAGVKIVELARVIAAPALGAVLSSFGAEVVKVESPDLPDPNALQMSLTAGKYTCPLDLNKEEDRQRLHKLLEDADVVVQAFRRRSLERKGFGLEDLLDMANKRGKGVVYLDLTCYGPDGTYSERPGFQQIADAASGCSYVCGRAYGFGEGVSVLPSLPVADMLTGAAGALDVMLALRDRARHGGSYHCDAALTAIDTIQLEPEFGLYSPDIVKRIQDVHGFAPMTPDLHVSDLLFVVIKAWAETTDVLKRKEFFAHFEESPFGKDHVILAPLVRYGNAEVSPYWTHSPVPYCQHPEVQWAS